MEVWVQFVEVWIHGGFEMGAPETARPPLDRRTLDEECTANHIAQRGTVCVRPDFPRGAWDLWRPRTRRGETERRKTFMEVSSTRGAAPPAQRLSFTMN